MFRNSIRTALAVLGSIVGAFARMGKRQAASLANDSPLDLKPGTKVRLSLYYEAPPMPWLVRIAQMPALLAALSEAAEAFGCCGFWNQARFEEDDLGDRLKARFLGEVRRGVHFLTQGLELAPQDWCRARAEQLIGAWNRLAKAQLCLYPSPICLDPEGNAFEWRLHVVAVSLMEIIYDEDKSPWAGALDHPSACGCPTSGQYVIGPDGKPGPTTLIDDEYFTTADGREVLVYTVPSSGAV